MRRPNLIRILDPESPSSNKLGTTGVLIWIHDRRAWMLKKPILETAHLNFYKVREYKPSCYPPRWGRHLIRPDDEAIQFAEGSPRSLTVNMALRVTSEASDAVTTGVTWSSKATVSIVDNDCIREIDSEKDGTKWINWPCNHVCYVVAATTVVSIHAAPSQLQHRKVKIFESTSWSRSQWTNIFCTSLNDGQENQLRHEMDESVAATCSISLLLF